MSPRRFSPCRRLALMLVLLASACQIACAGATRMPVRSRSLPATQIQASKLDNGFVDSTSAQQKETADKLASIDTGYRDPHLFWGRWDDSKAGYSRRAVSDATGGADLLAADGNAKHSWHVRNLLITFDDNGVIQKREVIDDDRVLWRRLHEHVAEMPPLDLSRLEFLSVDTPDALPILLHKEYFEVTAGKKGPVRIAPTSVAQFTHDKSTDKRNNATTTCHTMHLAEKTSAGKSIRYCGNGQSVVTLFRYLHDTGAKTMQGE